MASVAFIVLAVLASAPATDAEIASLRDRISAAPDDVELRIALDEALVAHKRYDEIVATWDEYIARNPEDGRAYLERGGTHTLRRDAAPALRDLDRACSLGQPRGCEGATQLRAMFAKRGIDPAGERRVRAPAAPAKPAKTERSWTSRIVVGVAVAFLVAGGGFVARALRRRRQTKPSTVGGPRARKAREEAAQGHLTSALELLRSTPDPELRWMHLSTLPSIAPDHARRLASAHPNDVAAQVLLSSALLQSGMQARGAAASEFTTREQFAAFEALSRSAVEVAERAAALAPDDPLPWLLQLQACYGLGRSVDEIRAILDEVTRRAPGHFDAHRIAAHLLSPKWFGDVDTLLEFARTTAASAPDGSDLPAIVLYAHFELFMSAAAKDDAAATAYVQRREVRDECRAAYARSLGHAAYRERPASAVARNHVCGWFYAAEMNELLAAELDKLGYAFTGSPWIHFGTDVRRVFADARIQAKLG